MTAYTFNQLFDFTRTTSATFVGSNGLIQNTPASVNLLLQTQQFDSSGIWGRSGTVSVVANTTQAPDGTTTADTILFPANLDRIIQVASSLLSATTYVFSVYVKGTSGETVNVELGSAVLTVTLDGTWQRVSVTNTGSTSYNVTLIRRSTTATSVFIWGAQLEANSTATTYTRNNGGVYPARFDYDPVTLAPKGILIEEQRTNLLTYSEEFDNAGWSKVDVTVTANATTSPDGTVDADKLIPNTNTADHFIHQGQTINGNNAMTISVYVKAAGYTTGDLRLEALSSPFNSLRLAFDLTAGTITPVAYLGAVVLGSSITNVGNGWYRISISGTTGFNGTHRSRINPNTATPFAGDGTSGLFIWGAQTEAGAFATSYIPTVASQVTRSADLCSIVAPLFSPWYNQSEGTFVVGFVGIGAYAMAVNDGGFNNYIGIATANGINPTGVTGVAAVQRQVGTTAGPLGTVFRTAFAYKVNDLAAATNGGTVATNATSGIPTVTQLVVGAYGGFGYLNGHIRSIKFYPFRASNNQLQALTT
jgi:hypothetical protein